VIIFCTLARGVQYDYVIGSGEVWEEGHCLAVMWGGVGVVCMERGGESCV
jgi:hypothetical protein